MAQAKGSVVIATKEFIRAEKGEETLQRILEHLPAESRERIQNAKPTEEIPFDYALNFWRAADDELRDGEAGWVEHAGGYSIEGAGTRMYAGLLRKSSPIEFLNQRVSLFKLYYHPGNMEVVEEGEDYAVLRLVGFDQAHRLFCRRQTGGLQRALTEAGGEEPAVAHVRCVLDGDAFCEWELRWQ
jgi:hypothetical protein